MDSQQPRERLTRPSGTPGDSPLPLGAAYRTLPDAVDGLARLEHALRERHDRRAIFTSAYLVITAALHEQIAAGGFSDCGWVGEYTVIFANLYRDALVDFERGHLEAVPQAWQIAFATCRDNRALLIQDLVLGINAHINYDLALALQAAGIDPQRDSRYRDHVAVNNILRVTTDRLQDQVCALYAPTLKLLDRAAGRVDELLANFSVIRARENAWRAAVGLAQARDADELASLRARLNHRSATLARLILSPNPFFPWLVRALRRAEQASPWWDQIQPVDLNTL
jgi:hypothetical protein